MKREELEPVVAELGGVDGFAPSTRPDPIRWGKLGKWVALDTETTSLEWAPNHGNILMATLYTESAGKPWYGLVGEDVIEELNQWVLRFLNAGGTLVLQNSKFDLHQLGLDPNLFPQRKAPQAPAVVDDAVLMHLIDSRELKRLENLEPYFLGTNTKVELKEGARTSDIAKWPIMRAVKYALNDARITYDIAKIAWRKVKILGLEPLYRKDERYMRLLWRAERKGVMVDMSRVDASAAFLAAQQGVLEKRLYDAVGYEFLWTSPQQLSRALYDDYRTPEGKCIPRPKNPYAGADGVDRSKFADRGKYNSTSTSSFLLLEKANHPLGSLILALRETSKLLCVFNGAKAKSKNAKDVSGWRDLAHYEQGYPTIHTTFNETGTRTGRLSSSRPQVQNIPSDVRVHETQAVYSGDSFHRTDAYNLRRCLVARPGHTMVSLDHKQQEGRLFGILSKDPVMREALEHKLDIHRMVAKLVWGNDDDLHREWAKTISFGMIYGMTTGSLQHRLNKTKAEADRIANEYLTTFPRIMPFLQEVVKMVGQCGYVRYWSGRIWREDSSEFAYKGANAIVQGGSADLISVAALRVQQYLDSLSLREGRDVGQLVLIVHDELVVEVLDEYTEGEKSIVQDLLKIMEVPDLFGLPFPADAKVGKDFGSMKKLDVDKLHIDTGGLALIPRYRTQREITALGVEVK